MSLITKLILNIGVFINMYGVVYSSNNPRYIQECTVKDKDKAVQEEASAE